MPRPATTTQKQPQNALEDPMQNVALIAGLAVLALVALYIDVRRHPNKPCRACAGSGKAWSKDGKSFGKCRTCRNLPGKVDKPRVIAKVFGVAK